MMRLYIYLKTQNGTVAIGVIVTFEYYDHQHGSSLNFLVFANSFNKIKSSSYDKDLYLFEEISSPDKVFLTYSLD